MTATLATNFGQADTDTKVRRRKSMLARLMATENITVEHKAVRTASFNVDDRTLVLPIFKDDLSAVVLDGYVAHEVGHALYTPETKLWHKRYLAKLTKAFGKDNARKIESSGIGFHYLNALEDIRIEKRIKSKFPGVAPIMAQSYDELHNIHDVFGLKSGKHDVSKLPFIDRLNLRFKMGEIFGVPFDAEEAKLIHAANNNLISFEDVEDMAIALMQRTLNPDDIEEPMEMPNPFGGGSSSDENDDSDDSDSQMSVGQSPNNGDDDSDENGGSDSDDDSEDSDSDESGSGNSGEDSDDESGNSDSGSDADGDSDSDGNETDESSDTNKSDTAEQVGGVGKRTDADKYNFDSETKGNGKSNNLPEASKLASGGMDSDALIDSNAVDRVYWNVTDFGNDIENCVLGFHKLLSKLGVAKRNRTVLDTLHAEFKDSDLHKNHASKVRLMAQRFNQKRAAQAHAKSMTALSGDLDCNKLHGFKTSEDLFLRSTITPDGKNHGMIMVLDGSGSMGGSFQNSISQILMMVMFCKAVKIPYRVFVFQDNFTVCNTHTEKEILGKQLPNTLSPFDGLSLVELTSSDLRGKDLAHSMAILYGMSVGSWGVKTAPAKKIFRKSVINPTSGTPLDMSIVAFNSLIRKFKRDHRIDIVNAIFMTDGSDNGDFGGNNCTLKGDNVSEAGWGSGGKLNVFRDESGKLQSEPVAKYGSGTTNALLNLVGRSTGARMIGYFIGSSYLANSYGQKTLTKGDGWVKKDSVGYDDYYIVEPRILKIGKTSSKTTKNDKILLQSFIDLISVRKTTKNS